MELTIREIQQKKEREALSPFATLSAETRGRERQDDYCPVRTPFQVDRDRILHSKAFRRLKHKTQVFLSPEGDHYRTRLTHTLEVSQIARTISRALCLNEDLTEAIALGHDLGHTPFGHAGERALKSVSESGFTHYDQSVRVVRCLEKDGRGLNLTKEVINGIERHTKGEHPFTPEGRIVRISDRIAYLNHDIEDAMRAGILSSGDIPGEILSVLGRRHSLRINTMVMSVIQGSRGGDIAMTDDVNGAFLSLHKFMMENVYFGSAAKTEEHKAEELIKKLFLIYRNNPSMFSGEFARIFENEGAERAALDLIAGMTDRYALERYKELFIPNPWVG